MSSGIFCVYGAASLNSGKPKGWSDSMEVEQKVKVVITGGTGFIGSNLAKSLLDDGHDVVILTRQPARSARLAHPFLDKATWAAWPGDAANDPERKPLDVQPADEDQWLSALDGADAVVHLAGTSIAAGRWNRARKAAIRNSRILGTRNLVQGISRLNRPPRVLISGSAIGFYGPRGDEEVTETDSPGRGFLSQVCQEWEQEARAAEQVGVRVILLRTGLVLDGKHGALPRMLLPFRLWIGGPLGNGRQWMSWIHLRDQIGLIRFLLEHPEANGPYNATAPRPVTNRQFSRIIGRLMHRPSLYPAPAPMLRLFLGEMAEELLLTGQRAIPKRALEQGYSFQHADLESALADILRR
jgi:hypothetical protein